MVFHLLLKSPVLKLRPTRVRHFHPTHHHVASNFESLLSLRGTRVCNQLKAEKQARKRKPDEDLGRRAEKEGRNEPICRGIFLIYKRSDSRTSGDNGYEQRVPLASRLIYYIYPLYQWWEWGKRGVHKFVHRIT